MKRLFLVLFSIALLTPMTNSEELKLPKGFTLIKSSSPYKMVLTPYTTYPVMLEEYVPKVLFEAKWGYVPGEFGGMSPNDTESIGLDAQPTSIAVNSKGEIYILDQFNNRIQKFNNSGKYMSSIPVLSMTDKDGKDIVFTITYPDGGVGFNIDGEPYYIGKNIVIDTEDNLYYYCQKGISGEVWVIKDDTILKKLSVKKAGGIRLDSKGEVWVGYYNLLKSVSLTQTKYDDIKNSFYLGGYYFNVYEKGKKSIAINVRKEGSKRGNKIELRADNDDLGTEGIYFDISSPEEFNLNSKSEMYIRYIQGTGAHSRVIVNKYDLNLTLLSIAFDGYGNMINNGDIYTLETNKLIKLTKRERKPSK